MDDQALARSGDKYYVRILWRVFISSGFARSADADVLLPPTGSRRSQCQMTHPCTQPEMRNNEQKRIQDCDLRSV